MGIWMRRVEPYQIAVQEQTIDLWIEKTVVLIADLHLGIFKDEDYLWKVVKTINAQTWVDMVFIAGDFTYFPSTGSLVDLFQPLRYLDIPLYAVLGNHDVERPGKPVRHDLVPVLEAYGVRVMQNDSIDFGSWKLVGLGDHDGGEDNIFILDQFAEDETVVVLTHNPDTTLSYNTPIADLTMVWHTHCGQVRLPWIHDWIKQWIIPVEGDFDCGLLEMPYTTLYITPWLGEVRLPIRWFNPPTIDILRL